MMEAKKLKDEAELQYGELIQLIGEYAFPADFINWISFGDFKFAVLSDHISSGVNFRIARYSVKDKTVFTSNSGMYLSKLSPNLYRFINQKKTLIVIDKQLRESCRLERKIISKTTLRREHIIIAQVYERGELIATCWEFYKLDHLSELLHEMMSRLGGGLKKYFCSAIQQAGQCRLQKTNLLF